MPKTKLTPLPQAAFQILLALAGEDLHGYGIMLRVLDQSEGKIKLGPGTLYSSIQSLAEGGLIEEIEAKKSSYSGDERRKYYRLTSQGRSLAREEAQRLAELLKTARKYNILRGDYV